MAKQPSPLFFLILLAYLFNVVASTPLPSSSDEDDLDGNWETDEAVEFPAVEFPKKNQRVMLGYNGFNGTPRPPQASAGGELGAVFYIADAVDLAKLFSNGANPNKNYICLVTADANEWARQPKVWVPQHVLALGGNAINRQYPGSVLFAPHAHPNPGAVPPLPAHVYQMGVRQAQISRLNLQVDCRTKAHFANDHSTLDYHSLVGPWAIQTPALSFSGIEEWLKAAAGLPWN